VAESAPTIGDRDGGVALRLGRRCRLAASILLVVGAVLLLVAALTNWGLIPAVLAVFGGALVLGAVPLARRASLWTATRQSPLPPPLSLATARPAVTGGSASLPRTATVGPSRPLSPGRPGAPVSRRLGAAVVPVLVDDGPAPGGGALIVHARGDAEALADGDVVRVLAVGQRGPVMADAASMGLDHVEKPVTTGRFVLIRDTDGQVFLATTRLTDTW